MNKDDLLRPRYKAAQSYPDSPFSIGEIRYYNNGLSVSSPSPNMTDYAVYCPLEKYPHIFTLLQ